MNGLDLIRADNPLLQPLGTYVNSAEWPPKLLIDPLTTVDRSSLTEFERKMLLKQSRTRFEPTKASIAIISAVQDMLWARCILGNPLLPENRFRTVQTLNQRGKLLADAPWLPDFADALMVTGCTGLGKSTAIKRYLSLVQPHFTHRSRKDAEWTRHLQVTYLVVPMPVHRGGLLFAILAAIDTTIGTSYRTQYQDRRSWPIEKLAIEVGILLVQHSVGMLIIEEIQARNFSMSPNREEMLLFILRVLNFGVPVVLLGNPMGFIGLEEFSQDLNRLTENEPIHLMPVEATDTEWADGLGPGMWAHNVMPQPTTWSDEISVELHACSAAFPGFVRKAVDGAQLLALGESAQAVGLSHLKQYKEQSQTFSMNKDLIEGFANRDPLKLMQYLDVPWELYGLQWGKLTLGDVADGATAVGRVSDPQIGEDEITALRKAHQSIWTTARQQQARMTTKSVNKRKVQAGKKPIEGQSTSGLALNTGLAKLRENLRLKQ